MAKKSLKQRVAEAFGLLLPATVVEIVPDIGERGDKAESDGLKSLDKATAMTNQANSLLATAGGHRTRGQRKIEAAKQLRKALGGQ